MVQEHGIYWVAGIAGGLLAVATVIGGALAAWQAKRRAEVSAKGAIRNYLARVASSWVMVAVLVGALVAGEWALLSAFSIVSWIGLHEFLSQRGIAWREHRTLVSACFGLIALQYSLVAIARVDLFLNVLPAAAFFALPALVVIARDTKGMLQLCGRAQWGVMVAGYGLSHLTGLFLVRIPGADAPGALLIAYVIVVNVLSDTMQYAVGKSLGRTPLHSAVSPNKTVEGLIGGGLIAILAGTALWWLTPFGPWACAELSAAIVTAGTLGGLVLSAVKRDLGVKDWGQLIPGHGGVLDRADSLCFAAPVAWWIVRGIAG